MRIVFLIRSLGAGGAERQLSLTATALAARGHAVTVLVFYQGGPFADQLNRAGVPIISLGKHGRWDLVPFFAKLTSSLAALAPDVLYSYLASSNIIAALYRVGHPQTAVIWGIRSSVVHQPDKFLRVERRVEVGLSSIPDLIIANADRSASHAIADGMPAPTVHVVQNGFDLDLFKIASLEGEGFRRARGIPLDAPLVGMVARIQRQKDFPNFLRAAAILRRRRPTARFICIGGGNHAYQAELEQLAKQLGVADIVLWSGAVTDMRAAYNALDVNCLLSHGEGFPNTVAEAMACGTPCVVSAVGDAAQIVDTCGEALRSSDPTEIADAICRVLDAASPSNRELQRARIDVRYSLRSMVERTESLMHSAATARKA
jgi:glycosyltransferase involved in cell wall biosynthesis